MTPCDHIDFENTIFSNKSMDIYDSILASYKIMDLI